MLPTTAKSVVNTCKAVVWFGSTYPKTIQAGGSTNKSPKIFGTNWSKIWRSPVDRQQRLFYANMPFPIALWKRVLPLVCHFVMKIVWRYGLNTASRIGLWLRITNKEANLCNLADTLDFLNVKTYLNTTIVPKLVPNLASPKCDGIWPPVSKFAQRLRDLRLICCG